MIQLQRAYYYCPRCRNGFCPSDQDFGLNSSALTPAAAEVACLASVISSFAESSRRLLRKLSGLRISPSALERIAETAGERIGRLLSQGRTFGPMQAWDWHRDAENKTCAYVYADATGIPIQGPKGSKAGGRMLYIGMIANPVPEDRQRWAKPRSKRKPPWQTRVVSSLEGLQGLAVPMRKQAASVGMDQAERWLALSDGGAGLEEFFQVNFSRVEEVILDFFHAAEYLGSLAKAWHGAESEEASVQARAWSQELKREGGERMLEKLKGLRGAVQGQALNAWQETVRYFENQKHRMDYPRYRSKGWAIGSGPVEGACKVMGQRLKGAGMRWGEEGADQIGHLRALHMSEKGQWDEFWRQEGGNLESE